MNKIPPSPEISSSLLASSSSEAQDRTETTHMTEIYLRVIHLAKILIETETSKEQKEGKIRNKIKNKIESLENKINDVETNIAKPQQAKARLKGKPYSKIPFLGTIIKFFLKMYYRENLERKTRSIQSLEVEKRQYNAQIAALREILTLLPPSPAPLPAQHEEMQISEVFEIEHQVRAILEQDFPEKEKYQQLYDQIVHPLVQRAKQALNERPFHFAVQAAAVKGQAAQAGFQAITNLAEKSHVITASGISAQEVFLRPKEGVVFKRSNPKAEEEENLINALIALMTKGDVLGTFHIQNASTESFGIQISQEVRERGFIPEKIPSQLLGKIRKKLSYHDNLALTRYFNNQQSNPALANYQAMNHEEWEVQLPGTQYKQISFKELQRLNAADQLPPETLIASLSHGVMSLEEHLLVETPFFKALNYFPTQDDSQQKFYLAPDLSNPTVRAAYEHCEKCMWSYTDAAGENRVVNFKTLQTWFLQKTPMNDIQPVSTDAVQDFPTIEERQIALNVPWKTVSTELMQFEDVSLFPLTNVQAKPFVSDMTLMKDFRNALLARLTPEDEFKAILTGELQFLDLHHGNLGIAPEPTVEYERFKDAVFILDSDEEQEFAFNNLVFSYLKGNITPDTLIRFEEGGKRIEKPLSELPELQKALDGRWQLVIFDTDLSLSEDNRLQLQTRKNIEEHLIPYRSVLLETSWKDQPLSEETIQHLMDSTERDARVEQWIKKSDAPIYKHLSPSVRQDIEQLLEPLINKHTLSELHKNGEDATVKSLGQKFAIELSNFNNRQYSNLWEKLEQDLSVVLVLPNDTWESIAKRHHQNVAELRQLNPTPLTTGQKVKINFDLTSQSRDAVIKRLSIASQLFPRMTSRQQNALLERQHRRRDYLNNYQNLSRMTLEGEKLWNKIGDSLQNPEIPITPQKRDELLNQLKREQGEELFNLMINFLRKPETPLTSIRRKDLLREMERDKDALLADPQRLLDLKKTICEECRPTYFNLMKAMYPLLADAYALNIAVDGNDEIAGRNIGLYVEPLENTIQAAKKKFRKKSPEYRLAKHLEAQIAAIKDPAFFGHW